MYCSEYYSGITAQLKLDLAAKRISHLVTFTVTNDRLKADYNQGAAALQTVIDGADRALPRATLSSAHTGALTLPSRSAMHCHRKASPSSGTPLFISTSHPHFCASNLSLPPIPSTATLSTARSPLTHHLPPTNHHTSPTLPSEYASLMTSLSEAPDNTFQGAADRLTKFTAFKSTHKSKVFSEHISLQAIMTNLASRLADNKRPEFCPVAPLDVQSRAQALDDIQDIEQRVAAALYEVGG